MEDAVKMFRYLVIFVLTTACFASAQAVEHSAESGLVSGHYLRLSNNVFIEKALAKKHQTGEFWVEVELVDGKAVATRKLFRADETLGTLNIGDVVAVKNAASPLGRHGLIADVDRVERVLSRNGRQMVCAGVVAQEQRGPAMCEALVIVNESR
jgi:hypothetical protein